MLSNPIMKKMQDMHPADRPRERFKTYGPGSLTNQELLAILLRTGTKQQSVLALADCILQSVNHVQELKQQTVEELERIPGIGTAKATIVLAAIELGKRMHRQVEETRFKIHSPGDAADYLMVDMAHLQQEHFIVLCLNVKNEIIHRETVFIGSLNSSIVHPREVFKEAFKRSAASVICAHNHPSGNPTPSPEDIQVTKRLQEVGVVMGIEVLDHIIIGDHQYISLKEKGFM